MKCPNCGADYPEREPRCPYCGTINQEGIKRKTFLKRRQDFVAQKEKETAKRSLPQAILHGAFWVMIVSVAVSILVFVGSAFFAGTMAENRDRQEEAKKEEHIAFLEQCIEEENYAPMETYLLDHGLYGEDYYLYNHMADLYQTISYARSVREELMDFDPEYWGEDYWQERLQSDIERVLYYCQDILQYDREEHYLYGPLPNRLKPVLEEYKAECMTTLSDILLFTEEEITVVSEYESYAEENEEYISISLERVKKAYGLS